MESDWTALLVTELRTKIMPSILYRRPIGEQSK
jgi:hypothetical protein